MEFGDPLFYEMPQADVDVPLSALRVLARRQEAFQPQSEFQFRPAHRQAPQDIPPMSVALPEPAPMLQSGWEKYVENFANNQQQGARKEDDDILERLRTRLLEMASRTPTTSVPNIGTGVAAGATTLDDYMRRNRSVESGGDPNAVNQVSGAAGLYQFLPSTWTSIMKEAPNLGLTPNGMHDEKQQDAAMRYYTDKSIAALKPILGRAPTGGELYALHLLGHAGGSHVIQNLDKPLTETISKAAMDGNPWLYKYRTGADLLNALNRKFA